MAPPLVRAGASGYAYKPWKGRFYPEDLPDAEMLRYYAERLPTVEINNTFYRLPKSSMLENWAAQTHDSFRFSIKASRRITHFARLKEEAAEPLNFLIENMAALGEKIGPILFQLPPNMKKDLPRLAAFLDLLPKDQQAAFEFRHPSWFEDDVFDALRAKNIALCIADSNDEDKTAPLIVTADWGYLRLRRDDYGTKEITAWAKKINAQSWREAYVFFKHEDEGIAPKLAQQLSECLAG
ncbi:MAG: DUF72 domain-containing protein [Proteobacteria bacterium]|nr:DUF72 domain-containing protein [Pseudomonadota bacterium]